ncbi:MAG: transposase, partial [Cytophagaceae bacterium]|nr:transposase [Gemmatimonadaceae bacterium]
TALRQQWSGPLLAKMRTWIDEQRARLDVADGSRLRKALNYAHNQWDGLTHFVNDGRVPNVNYIPPLTTTTLPHSEPPRSGSFRRDLRGPWPG